MHHDTMNYVVSEISSSLLTSHEPSFTCFNSSQAGVTCKDLRQPFVRVYLVEPVLYFFVSFIYLHL